MILSYTTAKKLKDLKFVSTLKTPDGMPVPTLSELIESIGYFQVLRKEVDIWKATAWIPFHGKRKWFKGIGSTPEEAVAKLWIELNQ